MLTPKATVQTTPELIGASVPRIDAYEKVTGAALFTDDLQFGPGLLYARLKRSPHPHALIKSIDTSQAKALARGEGGRHGREFSQLYGFISE